MERINRDASFCAHAVLGEEPLIIPDALTDARFEANPFVLGEPQIRFYAGAPLRSPLGGHKLGVLCVADTIARQSLNAMQRGLLTDLAALAVADLENRRLKTAGDHATLD